MAEAANEAADLRYDYCMPLLHKVTCDLLIIVSRCPKPGAQSFPPGAGILAAIIAAGVTDEVAFTSRNYKTRSLHVCV